MKINKILTILTFFLLLGCGFEPIYSQKKLDSNYNFTIASIGFSGNNNINQYLKNNLVNYINNKDKEIKYDLIINSSIIKTITSKNKKGNPEIFYTKIQINVDIIEDDKIIKPTVKYLRVKYNISGPYSADTIFLKSNRKKFDVIIGMYHDQVLTPSKTLFEYDAINITLGLPFDRISPDHGPNEKMLGKNISNPLSLFRAFQFLEKN